MTKQDSLNQLAKDLAGFYDDPYGYVMWAFPWGKGALSGFSGPRKWQKDFLNSLGKAVKDRGFNGVDPVTPIQMSRASGHGIGKSALTAWLIKWIMDTRPHSKGVVTANTSDQLRTKTWAELGKWHNLSITKEFFDYRVSRGGMYIYNKDHPETWRCDALTCREENSESFAGQHAANSTPFYIFDESSAIPESIFNVAQGGLTDGEPMFFLFGNPTRNSGFFRQTFGRYRHRWDHAQIDSRDVEGTNKELMEKWVEDYGEDSDFVRVRVRGAFPRAAVCQLIPGDLVSLARGKHLPEDKFSFAPVVLGVDVAWYGDDRSCVMLRQGLMSKIVFEGREIDSVDLAGIVAELEVQHQADAIFVDAGMGNGVIDQLRRLGRDPIPVFFGGRALKPKYVNKRSEMWGEVLEWLKQGPSIDPSQDLQEDLTSIEYHMTPKGQVQLEKKEDMKKRGLASPDLGDALALTFAGQVYKKGSNQFNTEPNMVETEFDIFS